MSRINYMGGLVSEFHHIKKAEGEGEYEPTLVIRSRTKKGFSFMIPLEAFWKYIDPMAYRDDERILNNDRSDFFELLEKNKRMASGKGVICFVPDPKQKAEAISNIAACQFAYAFSIGTGVMLCTSYNIAKFMQMFDISPSPQAAAQVLLWIQNKLDELKDMPELQEKDNEHCGGEVAMMVDGRKIATRDLMVTDTELILQEGSLN